MKNNKYKIREWNEYTNVCVRTDDYNRKLKIDFEFKAWIKLLL